MNQEVLLALRKEFSPLITHLSHKVPFKRMGFTVDDVESMFLDKLIHVYLKYQDKSYEELKYITSRSLQNYLTKLWGKAPAPMISLDDPDFEYITPIEGEPSSKDLMLDLFTSYVKEQLSTKDFQLFVLVNTPPLYITSRLTDLSKRIPSKLFLEFLGVEATKNHLKQFNLLRRNLQEKVEQLILQFRQTEEAF